MDSPSTGIVPFILSSLAQLLAQSSCEVALFDEDGWTEHGSWYGGRDSGVRLPVPALEGAVCLMTLPPFHCRG